MPDGGEHTERLLTLQFVLVVASGLAYFLALAMLNPVLPLYIDGPLDARAWVGFGVGMFALGAVLLRPFAGRIGDRLGRRVLLIGGAAVVSVATVSYGFVHALWWLCVVRFIAGVGEAAFFVGAATMIADRSPESRRGEAMSYWSVAVYGGLAFGPALGEWVLGPDGNEHFGRTWAVSAGLAAVAVLIGWNTREVESFRPATNDRPARLLHRNALAPGLILLFGLVSLAGWSGFLKLYARDDLGLDTAGGVFLLYGVLILCIRVIGAKLPDRIGPRRACTGALVFDALGMVIIASFRTTAALYIGTAVFAVGMSLLYPAVLVMALGGVPADERGAVIGTVSSCFDLSQGLGAAICGMVRNGFGYPAMFSSGAMFAGLGLVLLYSRFTPQADPERPDAIVMSP